MLESSFFKDEKKNIIDAYLCNGYKVTTPQSTEKWLLKITEANSTFEQYLKSKDIKRFPIDNDDIYYNLEVETVILNTNIDSIYQRAESRDNRTDVLKQVCDGQVITYPEESRGRACVCTEMTTSERYAQTKFKACVPTLSITGTLVGYGDFIIRFSKNNWNLNKDFSLFLEKRNNDKDKLALSLSIVKLISKETGYPYKTVQFKEEYDEGQ